MTQHLTSGTFAVGCRISAGDAGPAVYERLHTHACRISLPKVAKQHFTMMAAVTSPLATGAPEQAGALLDQGAARGLQRLHDDHAAAWKAFLAALVDGFG